MNNEGIEKRKPEEKKCVTVKKGIKKQPNFCYNFFYQAPPQNGLFCYISTKYDKHLRFTTEKLITKEGKYVVLFVNKAIFSAKTCDPILLVSLTQFDADVLQ